MKKFKLTQDQAVKIKDLIREKYEHVSTFCKKNQLDYSWVNTCLNNPEKMGEKVFYKIKKALGVKNV